MATVSNLTVKCLLQNASQLLLKPSINLTVCCRNASKKGGTTTQNAGNSKPKHRGWKVQDGHFVHAGHRLVKQNKTRFHPGLNVGWGRDGSLYAMEHGKVVVTCEKINPNWEHTWIQGNYDPERKGQVIYKKYFNIIPEPQHNRFKLIDKI